MEDDANEGETNESRVTLKHITSEEKRIIFNFLLQNSKDMKVKKGLKTLAASKFFVSTRSVARIWSTGKQNIAQGINFTSNKIGYVGRKRIQIDADVVKGVPLKKRSNICSLASAIHLAKSTMHRRVREGHLRPHTNPVKRLLTDENKKARLRFCLFMLTHDLNLNVSLFSSMLNNVHIDEKYWFTMKKKCQKYYLILLIKLCSYV